MENKEFGGGEWIEGSALGQNTPDIGKPEDLLQLVVNLRYDKVPSFR